ncbi:unnamed protein product [Pedinophyceae sp. YPF-701]|nr:unnamed protein product [Pedinophyceae sp. YPF-701]
MKRTRRATAAAAPPPAPPAGRTAKPGQPLPTTSTQRVASEPGTNSNASRSAGPSSPLPSTTSGAPSGDDDDGRLHELGDLIEAGLERLDDEKPGDDDPAGPPAVEGAHTHAPRRPPGGGRPWGTGKKAGRAVRAGKTKALVRRHLKGEDDDGDGFDEGGTLDPSVQHVLPQLTHSSGVEKAAFLRDLSLEFLQPYFNLTASGAASAMGVGLTALKRRCRELGILTWPNRKLQSIRSLIREIEARIALAKQNGVGEKDSGMVKLNETRARLQQEYANIMNNTRENLSDFAKALRMARYKDNYNRKHSVPTNATASTASRLIRKKLPKERLPPAVIIQPVPGGKPLPPAAQGHPPPPPAPAPPKPAKPAPRATQMVRTKGGGVSKRSHPRPGRPVERPPAPPLPTWKTTRPRTGTSASEESTGAGEERRYHARARHESLLPLAAAAAVVGELREEDSMDRDDSGGWLPMRPAGYGTAGAGGNTCTDARFVPAPIFAQVAQEQNEALQGRNMFVMETENGGTEDSPVGVRRFLVRPLSNGVPECVDITAGEALTPDIRMRVKFEWRMVQ